MRNNINIDLAALTRYPHSLFSVIQSVVEEDRKRAQTDAPIASREGWGWKLEVGSQKLENRCQKIEVGKQMLGNRGQKLDAGKQMLENRCWKIGVVNNIIKRRINDTDI